MADLKAEVGSWDPAGSPNLTPAYKYCVDSSICHLKPPKVILADSLGEVGNFYIILLSDSFTTK